MDKLPTLETARMPSLRDKQLAELTKNTEALPAKKGRKKLAVNKKK